MFDVMMIQVAKNLDWHCVSYFGPPIIVQLDNQPLAIVAMIPVHLPKLLPEKFIP